MVTPSLISSFEARHECRRPRSTELGHPIPEKRQRMSRSMTWRTFLTAIE